MPPHRPALEIGKVFLVHTYIIFCYCSEEFGAIEVDLKAYAFL